MCDSPAEGLRCCPSEPITVSVQSSCFLGAAPSQWQGPGCGWGWGTLRQAKSCEAQNFAAGRRSSLWLGQNFHGITLPSATILPKPPFFSLSFHQQQTSSPVLRISLPFPASYPSQPIARLILSGRLLLSNPEITQTHSG